MLQCILLSLSLALVFGNVSSRNRDSCEPLAQPKNMPSVNDLLDSATLHAQLLTIDTTGMGTVIVSVRPRGSAQARVVGVDVPTAYESAVSNAVLTALRPASKNTPTAFRAQFVREPAMQITVGRSVLCAPAEVNASVSPQPVKIGRVVASGTAPPKEPRSVSPVLRIGVTGNVEDVDLGFGSGYPEIDRALTDMMNKKHFQPALLDGEPVEVLLKGKKVELVK